MEAVVTIGLDIEKSVFQVHGVDGTDAAVRRHALSAWDTCSASQTKGKGTVVVAYHDRERYVAAQPQ